MEGRKRGRYPETRNDEREEVRTDARSAKRRREGDIEKKIRAGVRRRRGRRGREKGHGRAIREARRRWRGRAEELEAAAEIVP